MQEEINIIVEMLPFLIPLFIIQVVLMACITSAKMGHF
jgi:hypothetical protein